jgi:hypothetical protein
MDVTYPNVIDVEVTPTSLALFPDDEAPPADPVLGAAPADPVVAEDELAVD